MFKPRQHQILHGFEGFFRSLEENLRLHTKI